MAWWASLSTMEKGKKIAVPLLDTDHHATRKGDATNGVQVNIEARRARPNGWLFQGKAAVLAEIVRAFGERRVRALRSGRSGSLGAPDDPRTTNPYFMGQAAVVSLPARRHKRPKSRQNQAMVA